MKSFVTSHNSSKIGTFEGYLQLSRPLNVVIGFFSIFIGAFITGNFSPGFYILGACLSGAMITAAANAINDYFDIDIDRINKPSRPLPSGKVTPAQAYWFSLLLFILGIFLAGLINRYTLSIALIASLLLYLYSYRLKRTVLWGNLTVSLVSGLAFVYGGAAVKRLSLALIPATFAFLYHFGRELLKDMEDMHGDRLQAANTFPIHFGIRATQALITCIFLLLIFATLLPYIWGIFGLTYLLLVIAGVDVILLYVIISQWQDASPKNLHRLSNWLKLGMLVGLVAIYVGVTF